MRWCGKYPLKRWTNPSQSKEDIFYDVELWGDGKITCTCPAGMYKRRCRHIREKKEELASFYGGTFEAIAHFRSLKKQNK